MAARYPTNRPRAIAVPQTLGGGGFPIFDDWPKLPGFSLPKIPTPLAKGIVRAVPYIQLALLGYEAYEWWNYRANFVGPGWVPHPVQCIRAQPQLGWGFPANSSCQTTGTGTLPVSYYEAALANSSIKTLHIGIPNTAGNPRYRNGQQWTRKAGFTGVIARPGTITIPYELSPALANSGSTYVPLKTFRPGAHSTVPYARPIAAEQPKSATWPTAYPRPVGSATMVPVRVPMIRGPIVLWPTPTTTQPVVPMPDDIEVIIRPIPPGSGGIVRPITRSVATTASNKNYREDENKLSVRSASPHVWTIMNPVSEVDEFLRALHAALPEVLRQGDKTWSEKLESLARYWSFVDKAQALENLINDQIEDWVYGNLLGKTGKVVNQGLGLPTGGTRIVSGAADQVAPDWTDWVPTVDIDMETGSVNWTVGNFTNAKKKEKK